MELKTLFLLHFTIFCSISNHEQAMHHHHFFVRFLLPSCLNTYAEKLPNTPFWNTFLPSAKPVKIKQPLSISLPQKEQNACHNNSIIEQDKLSASYIDKLMDDTDSTSFKNIGKQFLELDDLTTEYPELKQLITTQLESPSIKNFAQALKTLSEQKKLPEHFNSAYQRHQKRITSMKSTSWIYYMYTINNKFS